MIKFSRKSSRRFVETLALGTSCLIAVINISCGRHEEQEKDNGTFLMAYGDSVLTVEEVVNKIPVGLDESDSIEMFRRIADNWAEDMLLSGMAEENSQRIDKINRMVADYRNRLIVTDYLKNMISSNSSEVTEGDVKRYYDANRRNMILEEPLVKGIYIKMPTNSSKLSDVRKYMAKGTESAVDHIEAYCLDEVAQYEYFGNRWIEWSGLSQQIPFRFSDPDQFLAGHKDFETEFGGSSYFLHIIDYVGSGSEMPYQYASFKIKEIIGKENSDKSRTKLLKEIYNKAINEGKFRTEGYLPGIGMTK